MSAAYAKSVKWVAPTKSYFDDAPPAEGQPAPAKREPTERKTQVLPDQGLKIEPGSIVILTGQQQSGKTNVIRQIVRVNAKDYNTIHIMCPTADKPTDPDDYSWLAPRFITVEPSIAKIESLIQFQEEHPTARMLLILDDCMAFEGFDVKGKFWKRLGSISRKYRMTIIVSQQNLPGMDTNFRDNSRVVFVLNCRGNTMPVLAGLVGESKGTVQAVMEAAHTKDPRACVRWNLYAGVEKHWTFNAGKAPVFYCRCRY